MCAAAPSSACGAVPCKAMKIATVASAAKDMATGRKALGCFSMVNGFILPPCRFAGNATTIHYKVLCADKPVGIAPPGQQAAGASNLR